MGFNYGDKIRALLAHAEDEGNSDAARQAYRNKAEQLMKDYAIAEEEALAVDPTAATPMSLNVTVRQGRGGHGDLNGYYDLILRAIARHTGVRMHSFYNDDWDAVATIVGYEGDVRYTEFLWTAAYLMFSTRIDPTWDEARTPEENIFLMRNAGIERRVIADKAWGNGSEASARSRVQRIYMREAARRGEEVRAAGLGFDTQTYRRAYADAFLQTLTRRLQIARDAANSVGGGLVLAGRAERVDEAFYGVFPRLRPSTDVAEPWVDPRTTCAKCAKAKTTCNEHSYLRDRMWTKADEARAYRLQNSPSARAGRTSGAAAADGVLLRADHTTARRIDPSGVAIEG